MQAALALPPSRRRSTVTSITRSLIVIQSHFSRCGQVSISCPPSVHGNLGRSCSFIRPYDAEHDVLTVGSRQRLCATKRAREQHSTATTGDTCATRAFATKSGSSGEHRSKKAAIHDTSTHQDKKPSARSSCSTLHLKRADIIVQAQNQSKWRSACQRRKQVLACSMSWLLAGVFRQCKGGTTFAETRFGFKWRSALGCVLLWQLGGLW